MKLDKIFEGSVFISVNNAPNIIPKDTSLWVLINAFYKEQFEQMASCESFWISAIPTYRKNTCYPLTKNKNSQDSVRSQYNVGHDDTSILWYELDIKADNMLEVIDIDFEKKRIKAKFKATFVSKNNFLPEFPQRVRFSDVYIEAGY